MIRILICALFVFLHSCTLERPDINKRIVIDRFVNLFDTTEVLQDETKMTLIFDSTGVQFYALVAEDNMRAAFMQHDTTIYLDPCVELFLDPGADGKDYYEFEINAAGYGWALKLKTNDSPLDAPGNISNWEIPYNYEAKPLLGTINDNSDVDTKWQATMITSYKSFSEGRPQKGDVWASTFLRLDYDHNNNPTYWVAKSTGREMIHYPQTWPTISF